MVQAFALTIGTYRNFFDILINYIDIVVAVTLGNKAEGLTIGFSPGIGKHRPAAAKLCKGILYLRRCAGFRKEVFFQFRRKPKA